LIASQNIEPAAATTTTTETLAIFGSVSTTDIANHIKGLLVEDTEASRISLEPGSIRFVGLEEHTDRVKTLGRWEVEISVGTAADTGLEPVRKMIEILPTTDGENDA
jgi:ribosomal protein L9